MDQKLYTAAMTGRPEFVSENQADCFARQLTPQGNTALHIAARFGHTHFARAVLDICPSLIAKQNKNGDTPFHVAARGGHLGLVKELTKEGRCSCEDPPLQLKNARDNTPLHEALKNRHSELALHLVEVDPKVVSLVNGDDESPLFIAADAGLDTVVERILTIRSASSQGREGKNALHAAANATFPKCDRIMKLLLQHRPELIKEIDGCGRRALHYAAGNNFKACELLLKEDRSAAYVSDKDGYTPFMIAVNVLHLRTAFRILDDCPDCGEIPDIKGCNVLHSVLKIGTAKTVESLLHRPELKELINEADKNGNTPLHLAAKYRYYAAAEIFINFKGVDLNIRNNAGQAPRDLVEADCELSFRQRSIWRALNRRHARISQMNVASPFPMFIWGHPDADYKTVAGTFSVVATLIATITFAAAFAVPGGYSSDSDSKGSAVLSRSAALKVFVIADTIALCCSITVIFSLVVALVSEPCYLRLSLSLSWELLLVALLGTVIAFVAAVYAILAGDVIAVAISVCIMGGSVPFLLYWVSYISQNSFPYDRQRWAKKQARDYKFRSSRANDFEETMPVTNL